MHVNDMQEVKDTLITNKMAHFNPKWITELIVDAGPEACASFLTQVNPANPNHRVLIHCASHEFTGAEINYAHIEKEAYACVWACMHDHLYLYGNKFNLITDNIGCQKIFQEDKVRRKIPPRLERLKAKLAPYNVTVIHRPGLQNIADFLSRRTAKIKSPKEIRSITEVPTSLDKITLSEIAKETDGDAVLSTVKTCLIRKFNNISRKKELKAYQQVFHEMEVHESGVLTRNDLIVLPTSLQSKAINLAHEGHLGIVMCKRLLRNRCWWPSIDAMITQEITDCAPCQANTDTTHHEPLIPTEMPRRKNGLTAIDFSSQTPTGEYVLVAYDEGKRYPALKLSRTLTSKEAIRICEELFDEMGIPAEVKSDNGPAFISKQFAEFTQRKGDVYEDSIHSNFLMVDSSKQKFDEFPFNASSFTVEITHATLGDQAKALLRIPAVMILGDHSPMSVKALIYGGSTHSFIAPQVLSQRQHYELTNNPECHAAFHITGAIGVANDICFLVQAKLTIGCWSICDVQGGFEEWYGFGPRYSIR